MANVTDPLARSVHGTNPQNLIEYITRQKIYDSLYWKEECFGLSASDVATKAAELRALGGSYGGNNKPTRFLCLALKMLQIQPDEGIVEEFLQNEDFKYVRALGAFYLRLTGRPAEIYELIEPLYNDFRKLRFRELTGWKITHVDELADELLTSDRYCGITLPHLPRRDVLVSAGYLDGPRPSALMPLIEEQTGGDPEKFLQKLADEGNTAAKAAVDERAMRKREAEEKERIELERREGAGSRREERYDRRDSHRPHENRIDGFRDGYRDNKYGGSVHVDGHGSGRGHRDDRRYDDEIDYRHDMQQRSRHHSDDEDRRRHRKDRKSKEKRHKEKSSKKYGSLFKKTSRGDRVEKKSLDETPAGNADGVSNTFEGSEEYWNEQRAKLGLKPLKD